MCGVGSGWEGGGKGGEKCRADYLPRIFPGLEVIIRGLGDDHQGVGGGVGAGWWGVVGAGCLAAGAEDADRRARIMSGHELARDGKNPTRDGWAPDGSGCECGNGRGCTRLSDARTSPPLVVYAALRRGGRHENQAGRLQMLPVYSAIGQAEMRADRPGQALHCRARKTRPAFFQRAPPSKVDMTTAPQRPTRRIGAHCHEEPHQSPRPGAAIR